MKDFLIHCIGDSHVSVFSGTTKISDGYPSKYDTLPHFRTYRIGAILAYSLGDTNHNGFNSALSVLRTIPVGSNILFCFGEIDCRAHVIRQKEIQNKPIEDIVKNCVDRYSCFLSATKNLGYKIIAWGAVPTYNIDEFTIKDLEEYPYYGTYKERNYATKIFNKYLKEFCHSNGMEFLSISDFLIDDNFRTVDNIYYMDAIHLSPNVLPLIIREIEKIESFL